MKFLLCQDFKDFNKVFKIMFKNEKKFGTVKILWNNSGLEGERKNFQIIILDKL